MGRMTEAERVRAAKAAKLEAREGYAFWQHHGQRFLGGFILGLVAATVLVTVLHTLFAVPR